MEKYDSMTVTFYTLLLASAASLPFADFSSMPAVFSSADWVLPLVLAFGPITCLLPYLFYTAGLAGTEPGMAGILATLEPVVSALLSVIVFHEAMNWQKVLGIVLILGSVLIVNLKPKLPAKTNEV